MLEICLALRLISYWKRLSGDFDQYWSYHVKQEYQRNHVAKYAEGNVTPVQGRSRHVLQLVK